MPPSRNYCFLNVISFVFFLVVLWKKGYDILVGGGGGGGRNSDRQGLFIISREERECAKERCIFVFCILNTSLKVFCISNTFQVLYLYLIFQIHFKCCICILYFKYKLHVSDPTLTVVPYKEYPYFPLHAH